MATFMISFRIDYDRTHSERWSSIVNTIHREAIGGVFWEETTSLIIIQSNKTADELASSIYVSSTMRQDDSLLVVNVTHNAHATRGKINDPGLLNRFFPQNALSRLFG